MRAELSFTECEHEGDLENYLGDLRESGAKIADSDINYEAEVGHVTIEVEVSSAEELTEAIKAGVKRLLLDNQSLDSLRELVQLARKVNPEAKLEASGKETLNNVAAVAATGVDYVSVGALTHSAPACDFSMKLLS